MKNVNILGADWEIQILEGGLDKTATFRVVCWERGGDFFGGDGVAIFT